MKKLLSLSLLAITMNVSIAQETKTINYLALGDSYTIGESVAGKDRWPVQLAAALEQKGWKVNGPTIIATTGWRTDNLKNAINIARLEKGYDLVSLLIGVNNQYQGKSLEQFEIEFEDLLQTAIDLAGGRREKVFVVSIPDYGFTPYGKARQEKISQELDAFNNASRAVTEKYNVKYFYITDISRHGLEDPELVASDGLHPSGKMYRLWVGEILKGLLGEKSRK